MKVLITGAGGQVGQAMMRACADQLVDHVGLSRRELDITDPNEVAAALTLHTPDYVINAAAISDVTAAQAAADQCYRVNRDGAQTLAKACHEQGVGLIFLSTDYVFDGTRTSPYTEDCKPNPQTVYGNSKLEGEKAVRAQCPRHLIVRTSWLFSTDGNNFMTRVLQRAIAGETVRGVNDQISSPTWTGHLAQVCLAMLQQVHCDTEPPLWGTYHYTDRGPTTRYDFARAIVTAAVQSGLCTDMQVEPMASSELNTLAQTPRQAVLATQRLFFTFGINQRGWRQGIKHALKGWRPEGSAPSTVTAASSGKRADSA